MYDFSGKVALVTGTAKKRGLGREIALRLAREGADIVVSDRYNQSLVGLEPWEKEEGWRGLPSLVEEIEAMGRRALAVPADISSSQEVNSLVSQAVKRLTRIDILVNNASLIARDLGAATPLIELPEELWHKALAVNLTGVFFLSRAVALQMIQRGEGGRIISISSIEGKKAYAGRGAYAASKFGVIGLTQALAHELAPHKINVNAVCPGVISTWGTFGPAIYAGIKQGLSEEEAEEQAYAGVGHLKEIPQRRAGKVEEVASVVAFLASNQSDYMTGQALNVTGGWLMSP